MSINAQVTENPFLIWVLSLDSMKAIELRASGSDGLVKDIILDIQGARRFGLGIHENTPYFGYVDQVREAIESVKWTSAAILYGKQGKDWVALSSTDARSDTTVGMNPIPIRLFVPVSIGRLAAWKELAPTEIAIGHMTANKKGEATFATSPFRNLPLKIS